MLHLGYFAIPQLGRVVKGAEGYATSTQVTSMTIRPNPDYQAITLTGVRWC